MQVLRAFAHPCISFELIVTSKQAMNSINFKPSKLIIPVYWLSLFLLIGHGFPLALVMCFGTDGHTTVEVAHTTPENPVSQQHRGRHVDIPLTISRGEQSYISALGPALQGVFPALAASSPPQSPNAKILPSRIEQHHLPKPPWFRLKMGRGMENPITMA